MRLSAEFASFLGTMILKFTVSVENSIGSQALDSSGMLG